MQFRRYEDQHRCAAAEAWLLRRRFRDELDGSAGPWLVAIARNKLLMSVRRAGIETRARARVGLELPRAEVPPSDPSEAWLDDLDEALSDLPETQREALRLRVEEDMAYAEVGAALGTTPQAARVRVHRALSTLRQRLAPNSLPCLPPRSRSRPWPTPLRTCSVPARWRPASRREHAP